MFAEHTTGNDLSFVILSYRESNREGVSSRWIDFHLTSIFPFCILVYSHSFFSEPKADAQVRVERHGGSLHRGDDDGDHDAEEQPGVAAGAAGQQERQLHTHQEDEMDGGTEVRLILIRLLSAWLTTLTLVFSAGNAGNVNAHLIGIEMEYPASSSFAVKTFPLLPLEQSTNSKIQSVQIDNIFCMEKHLAFNLKVWNFD